MQRRHFLNASAASLGSAMSLASFGASGQARAAGLTRAEVVVIGGGYGGATAAKYLRLFSNHNVRVTLIEPDDQFVSCPLSNLVVGGSRSLAELTRSYDELSKRHDVKRIKDRASVIDPVKKTITLGSGSVLRYDKLVLSPGVSMIWDSIQGLAQANAAGITLQAWKAGPDTHRLHKQISAMRDGGVFALSIPEAPYRCPPGPYERVCQVASYLKQHKPKSKLVVLDANQDIVSKGALFKKAWSELYPGMIDYMPLHNVMAVDAKTKTLKFDIQEDVTADVLNILPNMRAGEIAVQTGLANVNKRWVGVDFLSFESTVAKDIHVIGDATQNAQLMPKSGHMANQHAKVAAAAIVAELNDWPVAPSPLMTNTCYSFVDPTRVVHVASVHAYDAKDKTFKVVPGSGGLSPEPTVLEATYAWSWARNIWADMLV